MSLTPTGSEVVENENLVVQLLHMFGNKGTSLLIKAKIVDVLLGLLSQSKTGAKVIEEADGLSLAHQILIHC
jgi:hypothetical protein